MIASLSTLDPELATRALLELLSLNEGHELPILLRKVAADSELIARLANVEGRPAAQAVVLVALRAHEFGLAFLEDEGVLAVWCWAPRKVGVEVHGLVQC